MRYLILTAIILSGCGTIEGDVNIDAEGKEEATTETSEVTEDTETTMDTETVEEPEPVDCQAGKLCKGMTTQEVLEIVPEPSSVRPVGRYNKWIYTELLQDTFLCAPDWIPNLPESSLTGECTLTFRNGKLTGQYKVKTEWLDLESF